MNGGGRDDLSFILSVGRSLGASEGGRERLLLTRPLLRPQRARAPPTTTREGRDRGRRRRLKKASIDFLFSKRGLLSASD